MTWLLAYSSGTRFARENERRVALGVAPPELPQIRTCPIKASGSSGYGLTTHGGAPARGTGKGK
jgi:hypothetical protein